MTKRIYLVTEADTDTETGASPRLISAASQAAAIQVAIAGRFEVKPATTMEVAELMKAGVIVEPTN